MQVADGIVVSGRIRRYRFHVQVFYSLFMQGAVVGGYKVLENGFPKNGKIVDVDYLPAYKMLEVLVESDDFPETISPHVISDKPILGVVYEEKDEAAKA